MEFVGKHRNIAFFVAFFYPGIVFCETLSGMSLLVSVPMCASLVMIGLIASGELADHDDQQSTQKVVAATIVATWALCMALYFVMLRKAPDIDLLLGKNAASMTPAILAVATAELARLPSAPFVLAQATLGLLVAVAVGVGVLAAGRFLYVARLVYVATAVLVSLCVFGGVGSSYQDTDYPARCELAQKAYAGAMVLDAQDVKALELLGCQVTSTHSILATGPLVMAPTSYAK